MDMNEPTFLDYLAGRAIQQWRMVNDTTWTDGQPPWDKPDARIEVRYIWLRDTLEQTGTET